jgi:PAS domain S-box-containing protein
VSGDDEVGQLGATFNEMTGSLLRMTDDLKAAAREEHDLRERIEKIIQSMADGLVAVDAEARVVALNAEAENMTGVDFDSVSGAPIEDIIVVLDSQGQRTRLPLFEVAGGSTANVFLERKHGEPVPVTVTSAVLRDEKDYVSGSVAIMRDMTREREVERLKSEFLSNISHELRTPLTPIKGFAEILSSKQLAPDKTRQFATGILDIVGLLVDYTALESGRLAPSARPVDVAALLEKLRSEWARRDRRHEFVTDVVGTLPWVLGDERLLKRSLEEIIDNAVKFSPHGGTVRLAARRGPGSNGDSHRVEVVISDEGIGIERDDLHKVFSDFRQLDGSQTRAYGGLGLGLAFVRRIVEAHSGTVDVQSEPERGTRLIVSIPAAEGAPGN